VSSIEPGSPEGPTPSAGAGAPAVDLRILQANERTLLAWIRTGVALMAFGFVVSRLGLWLRVGGASGGGSSGSVWIGAAFIVLGTVTQAASARRYVVVQRAIVEGRSIVPSSFMALALVFALVVLGGVLLIYVIL
jgi:putative membrane protein